MRSAPSLHPTFIGIDLAWVEHNPSGAVCLEPDGKGGFAATGATTLGPDVEVLAWIEEHAVGPAIVAIDAPIIAPNPPGTGRPVDRETSRQFGRYDAGAYPGNSEKCARPVRLAKELCSRGWSLDPAEAVHGSGRYAIEVYPHAATIGLFGLDKIVKYKKGTVEQKQRGLARLQALMHERLPMLHPPIQPFEEEDPFTLRGRALKGLEDRLDAVLCAAMAVQLRERTEATAVLGDLQTGYIVVPRMGEQEHDGPSARGDGQSGPSVADCTDAQELFLAVVNATDRAIEAAQEAGDDQMAHALVTARAELGEHLVTMAVRTPQRRVPRRSA